MRECNIKALTHFRGDLKINVNVGAGILDLLGKPEVGFLNRAEILEVKSCKDQMAMMDTIINNLCGKEEKYF